MEVMLGIIHLVHCTPQFAPQVLDGVVQAGPFYRCPLSADIGSLPWNDEAYHCLLGSENYLQRSAYKMVLRCPAICPDIPRYWRSSPGAQEMFLAPLWSVPMTWTEPPPGWTLTACKSLVEAFSRQSMNSHAAIYSVQYSWKTWLISQDDMAPSSRSQVLPAPCPV